jgi:hypothetical protein
MLKVLLGRLAGTDRSRSNALLAARSLSDARLEREEVDAYLAAMPQPGAVRPGAA